MNLSVLVCTPTIWKSGGVAHFYRVLRRKWTIPVDYHFVGSRTDTDSFPKSVARLVSDYVTFYVRLLRNGYSVVHLNPSLDLKSVCRDAVLLLIAKLHRRSVIVFFRGWTDSFESNLRGPLLFLFRQIYSKADVFVVLASEFRERLLSMGFDQPIYLETTVVDDGIDSISHLHKDDGSFNILFMARIERAKGIYETIDAYRVLKNKYSGVTLTIAGDGSELEHVRETVKKLGLSDVEILGHVVEDKKLDALQNAHVYILPTFHGEGMPNSVLEAMMAGLPVITRPVGGIKDFFQDSAMGFITTSTEPNVYAEFIERLILNDPLRKLIGQYNSEFARNRFSASQVVQRLQSIYRELHEGGRKKGTPSFIRMKPIL